MPNTHRATTLCGLLSSKFKRRLARGHHAWTHRVLVHDRDPATRLLLAANPCITLAVQNQLVRDPSISVRTALALNPHTSITIQIQLSQDPDISHLLISRLLTHTTAPEVLDSMSVCEALGHHRSHQYLRDHTPHDAWKLMREFDGTVGDFITVASELV